MTETDELAMEDWSDSYARTTEWSPKYLHALHMAQPALREPAHPISSQSDRWLYVACGAAALVLGLVSSRALAPLIFGSPTPLSQELLEDAPLPQPLPTSAAPAAKAKATRAHKTARARPPLQAAKPGSRSLGSTPLRGTCAEEPVPPAALDATPDLNLMDAPSSPMELRALADSRARMSANSQQVMEQQRQHDPMGQLDVLQDPGVELGVLRINSRPWSQVFIDGKPAGTTPILGVSLSPGEHSVRLVNNTFHMRKTFDIVVNAGESISHVVSLDD
jgi:hypothetical protein